uniref:RNB domain-containing protein n=1 Tax=Biomphalaria glabrata TaxID=6526 RepID=A0A2C9KWS8_BIOGL
MIRQRGGRGGGRGGFQRQQRPNPYESYLPLLQVRNGLRLGQLKQGFVRMFPSSKDEAIVTTQDGTEILLTSMNDRNRAFPGDEVAVEVYTEEQWMVNIEEFTSHCEKVFGPLTEAQARALKDLTEPKANPQGAKASNNKSSQPRRAVTLEEFRLAVDGRLSSLVTSRDQNSNFIKKTGKVVHILTEVHSRAAIGSIKPMKDNDRMALLILVDRRLPAIKFQINQGPSDFLRNPNRYQNLLFKIKVPRWEERDFLPLGSDLSQVGQAGDIDVETQCILLKHDVDDKEFSPRVSASIRQLFPWRIPASELAARKDLRDTCIFTIDSKVTDDMDDALSIEEVETGVYQVGVHIADVSYFVRENTELDDATRERAVSVYLENKIVHMIPIELSENLCSLIAGQDRLAFSILWRMNGAGEILNEWIGKTIIKSCVSLTYDVAQNLMDDPKRVHPMPQVHGRFTIQDVIQRMRLLKSISNHLKAKRLQDGALMLESVEVVYELDPQTGKPTGYKGTIDHFQLVQELMVLANKAVARNIYSSVPEKAILRIQPEPREAQLQKLVELCQSLGITLNVSSPGALQASLEPFRLSDEGKWLALSRLVMKCFQKSKLVCRGSIDDETPTYHYTLNTSCYTDFTSPIRRYSDVLVHRVLAASLGDPSQCTTSKEDIQNALDRYSRKNASANSADSDSVELFLSYLIQDKGPLQEPAIVLGVYEKYFEVLLINLNITRRVYIEDLKVQVISHNTENNGPPALIIEWPAEGQRGQATRQRITILSRVVCKLVSKNEQLKWTCLIERP